MHTNATPANDARPAAGRSRRRRPAVANRVRRWLPLLTGTVVLLACGAVSRRVLPVKPIPGPLFSCVMSDSAHEFQRRQPLPYRVSMYFADVLAVGESRVMAGIAPPAFGETLGPIDVAGMALLASALVIARVAGESTAPPLADRTSGQGN